MVDLESLDLEETEKTKLFMELATDIFPTDSWEDWELKALCRIGLARWFGVEDECDCED